MGGVSQGAAEVPAVSTEREGMKDAHMTPPRPYKLVEQTHGLELVKQDLQVGRG